MTTQGINVIDQSVVNRGFNSGQTSLGSAIPFQAQTVNHNDSMLVPGLVSGNIASKVRVLVTLRKSYGSQEEYKKMMLIISSLEKVHTLKRAIEREFLDLFPNEQPYVVAKLEDAHGFSLSNGSNIGDFIANG